jgi:type I restriction enzyme M protein
LLDAETKQRIDRARNALVGKIPDPKAQIEQITFALIFKFMDELQRHHVFGAHPNHTSTNGRARFGWKQLMQSEGFKRFELYSMGLRRMGDSLEVPDAIRRILRNAQVSYADPGTLARFLETIDEFNHDHLEQLGDALEYLFSVLGSQGAGGQFRTPDHIREFIVSTVDPKPNESILDPACGTAGFLISALRHMLRPEHPSFEKRGFPSQKADLQAQFWGYDISPEMVRLSSANLVLHGLKDPCIFEHDVLASENHWGRCFDVIFSNPPFMTPRGGINSHPLFYFPSKRSELLFLQYIATHLTEKGRAGIVVPEGILFQNRGVYKEVRRMLVNGALVAIVSLPPGCFNPYSAVRTSILFLDKGLANSETIAFFRAENDGFRLGRPRSKIAKDDLPQIQKEITAYFDTLRQRLPMDPNQFSHGKLVSKAEIRGDGEFNLTHWKYQRIPQQATIHPRVPLGDLVEFLDYRRRPIRKADRKPGPYPYYGATGVVDHVDRYLFDEPLVLVGEDGAKWGAGEHTAYRVSGKYWVNNHAHILRPRRNLILDQYLQEVLNELDLRPYVAGVTVSKLTQERLKGIPIPLLPIRRQRKIIIKIEDYESAIVVAMQTIAGLERKIRRARKLVWSR